MESLGKKDIADIFVGTEIIFHMKKEGAKLDEKAILAALKKHKQKAKGDLKKDKKYIL